MQKEEIKRKFIEITSLSCIFNKNQFNEVIAIDNLSISFDENQIHFIIGNSGSGKTTLILHFNGLIKLKNGHIKIDDFYINPKKKIKKPKNLRKKISMVFQFPEYQLFKDTIISDVSFGPKVLGIPKELSYLVNLESIHRDISLNYNEIIKKFGFSENQVKIEKFLEEIHIKFNARKIYKTKKYAIKYKGKIANRISEQKFVSASELGFNRSKKYLNSLGIDDSFFKRSPFGLSGGQKRRVAIAGILSIEPKVLVFDEPTAGLDPAGEHEMIDIIKKSKENKQTIFVVSHNMDHVLELADNVVVMDKGRIIATGKPYDIFLNDKLCKDIKLDKPKIIDFILNLIDADEKYSYLLDSKPKTTDELAIEINRRAKK